MFGRSGQMFPRQRAFHDAIYEEEYGSDHEEECCQSRGISAIFCWFLSVIILIGLAASVVLTVFFILKSKNYISKNGELEVLYEGDHGLGFRFPTLSTTTELNNLDFPSSASGSKEFHSSSFENDDENESDNNHASNNMKDNRNGLPKASSTDQPNPASSTTRFPPSRRGPFEMSSEQIVDLEPKKSTSTDFSSHQDSSSEQVLKKLYSGDQSSSHRHGADHRQEADEGLLSSTTKLSTKYTTVSTPQADNPQVLFTLAPETPTTTYRRNLLTTRFPTGRISFSSSTPPTTDNADKSAESKKSQEEQVVNKSAESDEQNNPEHHEEDHEKDHDNDDDSEEDPEYVGHQSKQEERDDHPSSQKSPTTISTTPPSTVESLEKATEKAEESQLNKMLLEEIPPHKEIQQEDASENIREPFQAPSISSEFNLPQAPSKEVNSRDPLARIIKNLAPKWARNRTIETTTPSIGNRYDVTISSRERDQRVSLGVRGSVKPSFKETSTRSTNIVKPETGRPSEQSSKLGGKRGNTDQPTDIIHTIPSPDLSRRPDGIGNGNSNMNYNDDTQGESPFLDVLVGSDDQKTLITKQTEGGIVTSAILPPWYTTGGAVKNNGSNDMNNSTQGNNNYNENPNDPEESSAENRSDEIKQDAQSSEEDTGTRSVFGGLLDLFNKLPLPNNNYEGSNKPVVLKRPQGELLAEGSSTIIHSSEGVDSSSKAEQNVEGNALETSKLATVRPPFKHDDDIKVRPASTAFHYGTSDGGTHIYGYYPDEEKESDKTVERQGIQSETLSDETLDNVSGSPTHSIEVQVGSAEGSQEIVIHDDAHHAYSTRYGEAHAGSENIPKYVEPPVFHGGGIRRPLGEDKDMDMETKGSENKAVYAVANKTSNLRNGNTNEEDDSVDRNQEEDNGRVNDLSEANNQELAEPEDEEEFQDEHLDHHRLEGGSIESSPHQSGSFEETSGSSERTPGKWSQPDKFAVETSSEGKLPSSTAVGSEELKVDPDLGDSNEVIERKPVSQLDNNLYTNQDSIENLPAPHQKLAETVHEVYPEGYSLTTPRPDDDEPTLSEPEKSTGESNDTKGFVAPTAVSFHDNKYTFSPPNPQSMYQSKDGWRPLVYSNSDDVPKNENGPTRAPWQYRKSTIPSRFTRPPPTTPKPFFEEDQKSVEEEEEEEEETHDDNAPSVGGGFRWEESSNLAQQQQAKIKFPEPPPPQKSFQRQDDTSSQQHDQEINEDKLIANRQPLQQQQPNNPHPNQFMQHHNQQPHPHQLQQLPQPPPIQNQRPRHPNQYLFQTNPNIDRSKYMMRPAPPPIVMRRAPNQNMPYLQNRNGPPRPQLIPHIQQANQFANALPTESPQTLPSNRRLFKNLGPRPRSNVNWPTDDNKKLDKAERRTG